MIYFLHDNRRLRAAGIAVVVFCIFTLLWGLSTRTPAYAVYVDGRQQFIVKNRAQYEQVLQQIKNEQKQKNQEEKLAPKIALKLVLAKPGEVIAYCNLENSLKKALHLNVMAAAIVVQGKTVAYMQTQETARNLLERIKQDFTSVEQGEKLVSVKYLENVQIRNEDAPYDKIMNEKQAYDFITTGTECPEKYKVQEGDSLWLIARRNDMLVKDITQANHIEGDRLKPGQELVLVKSKPYITVIAQVQGERDEQIPYEVKVVVDPRSGSSVRVSQDGQTGQKHVVYTLTKVNGSVNKKEVTQEKIIKAAVNKILVKGNKVQLASRGGSVAASGDLDWPLSGSISQYFGHNGHTGLDICAPVGTAIKAADSGYVTFAGYQGGYGKFIIIDHGNGVVTRYAHCSSLNVSVGQSVSKGQKIGAVGLTGHTTGPHLHFEVQSGGSFRNPLSYLN